MKLEFTLRHLTQDLQPGDSLQLRSAGTQDVNICCAEDGRIEIIVSGFAAKQAIVIRAADLPDGSDLAPALEAERQRLNPELSAAQRADD